MKIFAIIMAIFIMILHKEILRKSCRSRFVQRKQSVNYLFLNLKRFDIVPEWGGVNRLAPPHEWGGYVASRIQTWLRNAAPMDAQSSKGAEFSKTLNVAAFFPEAHIISAVARAFRIRGHIGGISAIVHLT